MLKPAAGNAQGFNGDLSLLLQFGKERELIGKSFFHTGPAEAIFLTGLSISEAETLPIEILTHIPIDPSGIATACAFIGRLQSDNTLTCIGASFGTQTEIVLIYGVRTQHPEQRHGELCGFRLGGEEHIGTAGIVALAIIATPEGIAVCAVLLFTIAESISTVLVGNVAGGVGIEEPGTEYFGVIAEDFFEFSVEFV